jgi:hypothetical protein
VNPLFYGPQYWSFCWFTRTLSRQSAQLWTWL